MKGRAWGQGTMPRRTPLATMRTGVSCISAKATATWRYTGSSRASRALMLPSTPTPTPLPACSHTELAPSGIACNECTATAVLAGMRAVR